MGAIKVLYHEGWEAIIVEEGEVLKFWKNVDLPNKETVFALVHQHDVPGEVNIRVELSEGGHREAHVYHGRLGEGGVVDFGTPGIGVTIAHEAGRRK